MQRQQVRQDAGIELYHGEVVGIAYAEHKLYPVMILGQGMLFRVLVHCPF